MKLQNIEAIIVIIVMVFGVLFLVPRCRANRTQVAATTPTTPTPTPQPLPPADGQPAATTSPATATPEPAAPAPAPTETPTTAPATTATTEKVKSPEEFARKLTPKPMNVKTKTASNNNGGNNGGGKEETVPFDPDGGSGGSTASTTVLYTVVSDVKLRAEPGLESKVLGKIPKGVALTYLRVKTDRTQKLTVENVPMDEPWLKIKTPRGTIGWVYGGTVRNYKK